MSEFIIYTLVEMIEIYLIRTYKNVESFLLVKYYPNYYFFNLIGEIRFKSGKTKKVTFKFDYSHEVNGLQIYRGKCKEIIPAHKPYKLYCTEENGVITPSRLDYYYIVDNEYLVNGVISK